MRQQLDELLGHTHNSSLKDSLTTIKTIANEKPYYKYNQIWSKYMENVSFCYVLKYYIEEEKLMSYDEVAERMGGIFLSSTLFLVNFVSPNVPYFRIKGFDWGWDVGFVVMDTDF